MPYGSITTLAPYGTPGEGMAWNGVANIQYDHTTYLVVVILGTHYLTITGGSVNAGDSHIDIGVMIRI